MREKEFKPQFNPFMLNQRLLKRVEPSLCCDDQLNLGSTSLFDIVSGCRRPASSPLWAALATVTTTRWPRPSTGCSRPRSSTGAGLGRRARRSNWPRWSGSRGSTTIACWSPSATSRRPRPKRTTGDNKTPTRPAKAATPNDHITGGLNHEYMAQPGGLRRPPAGADRERIQQPSSHLDDQANPV
jgi:hypothetical protein